MWRSRRACDAGPRDPHEALPDARSRRRRVRAQVPRVLREVGAEGRGEETMLDVAPRMVLDAEIGFVLLQGARPRTRRSSRSFTTTPSTSSCARKRSAAGARSTSATPSISNTGTSSKPSCARPARRPRSPARWRSSPAPRRESARRASTRSSSVARRLSPWTGTRQSSRSGSAWMCSASPLTSRIRKRSMRRSTKR